ncbi:Uncharacterised protein [uncultured archaeon]|nr:Uncharacterised protein [uncultured archaeon]
MNNDRQFEQKKVDFETLKSEEVKFKNDTQFVEIARKKAKTDEGENEFVSISRGYFTPQGERRFRRSVAIPSDANVVEGVANALKNMIEE